MRSTIVFGVTDYSGSTKVCFVLIIRVRASGPSASGGPKWRIDRLAVETECQDCGKMYSSNTDAVQHSAELRVMPFETKTDSMCQQCMSTAALERRHVHSHARGQAGIAHAL